MIAFVDLPKGKEAGEEADKVLDDIFLVLAEEAHREDGVEAHDNKHHDECVADGKQCSNHEGAHGWNDGREAVKRQAYRVFNVTRVAE